MRGLHLAVIWSKKIENRLYEVRTAGKTLRLYTNGILHSQYHPDHLMTGSVWDFLALGGFWVPEGQLKRVLVLGVGGGVILHQIRKLFSPDTIVGIELSDTHVQLGRKFFGLNREPYELITEDAIAWLKAYKGQPFDLIIDDMFDDRDGEPYRVAQPDQKWLKTLFSHLSKHGTLVMNFADKKVFDQLKAHNLGVFGVQSAYRLTTDNCENIVGVLGRKPLSPGELRGKLRQRSELDTRRSTCRLKYHIRPIYTQAEIRTRSLL